MLLSRYARGRWSAALPCSRRSFASANKKFDLAVIGGGPGGYVAAIKAAQMGLSTVCIEKRSTLGGTCLNVGCIPSKALLNISHKYHELVHQFPGMGIVVDNSSISVGTMQKKKAKAIKGLTTGIAGLFKKNKVTHIVGEASIEGGQKIAVANPDGKLETVEASNILIATGSEPSPMPGGALVADEKVVVTSTGALDFNEVPKSLVIVGGGVIGLELGSVWLRLGAKVEVIEFLDRVTPGLDQEVSLAFKKILEKQGMVFHLSHKVTGADVRENDASVHYEPASGGEKKTIDCDRVIVAVGRRPFTAGLGLDKLSIETDKLGRIVVDEEFKIPSNPTIRAIGDVIPGPMLAHKAEEEGVAAVELIAGKGPGHVNYDAIPSVVYTHPEVAGVGKTEEELKSAGVKYRKGSFPFMANSRARTNDDADGMVKILADKETDQILGAWIMGPNAGELIQEVVVGIEYGATSEDIGRTCHPHPTLSEAVKEACMATYDKAIHF